MTIQNQALLEAEFRKSAAQRPNSGRGKGLDHDRRCRRHGLGLAHQDRDFGL